MKSSRSTSPWRISRRGLVATVPAIVATAALIGGPAQARPRTVECLADLRADRRGA